MAQFHLAPPAGCNHRAPGRLADDRRAVALRRDHGAERPRSASTGSAFTVLTSTAGASSAAAPSWIPASCGRENSTGVAPWDKLFIYDLRLQSTTETINAISKDGVNVTAQTNVRYQLAHRAVAVLHNLSARNTWRRSLTPKSAARRAESFPNTPPKRSIPRATRYIPNSCRHQSLGTNLDKLVQPQATEQPDPKGYNDFLQGSIQILDTLVLSIELPPVIVNAINRQTEQFYLIRNTNSGSRAKPRS